MTPMLEEALKLLRMAKADREVFARYGRDLSGKTLAPCPLNLEPEVWLSARCCVPVRASRRTTP